MRTRGLLLLFVFSLLLPVNSTAQVGSLLKNKMNKVVNAGVKTVDKEVDAEIDTAVNKEAEKAKTKADARTEKNKQAENQPSSEGGQAGGGMFGSMFSNKVDLKYKEDYSFTSRIYMISETYDNKDVMKMDMYMFYSATQPSIGMETKSISDAKGETVPVTAVMVVDGENKIFLMLTDMNGMKMGIISSAEEESAATTDSKGKKDTPPVYTKTGNTREIAGYKCDEYSYIDPDDNSKGKVWFTQDPRLKIDRRGWKNTGMSAYYSSPQFNDGIILANEAYDDKGKLTMKTETIEINENFPHNISVKGYSLRQMNSGKSKEEKK
ncbi:MAG: hypothetical protein A2X05_05355 [Bacteroidetes bacterium GWE2_41_25]|nr:MAG: hypothetical protein A2X05_05355 [Bacteroidetes bacterium GWE2_41_25]HCU20514.1 hypothetical protein [Bacteroidales bacterium]